MLVTQRHHHLEWGNYLAVMSILGALVVFASMLLQDCSRILPRTVGG
jgi:hypothetical protein